MNADIPLVLIAVSCSYPGQLTTYFILQRKSYATHLVLPFSLILRMTVIFSKRISKLDRT